MENKEKKEFLEFQIYKLKKQKQSLESKLDVLSENIKQKTEEMKSIKIYSKKSK